MSTFLATIVVLGVLIFIHELGHFLAGKAVDVEIQRFSIGVGPKLFGYKYGETDYVFSWIPLGGYVKFGGMGEDEMLEKLEGGGDDSPRTPGPRDFDAKPIWARGLILSAGVIFNMLFAFGAYTYVIAEWGVPELSTTRIGIVHDEFLPPGTESLIGISSGSRFVQIGETEVGSWGDVERGLFEAPSGPIQLDFAEPDQSVEIRIPVTEAERRALVRSVDGWMEAGVGSVVPGSPADEGGLEPGDRVTAVAGIDVEGWFEFTSEIRSRPGERVEVTIVREGREIIRAVTVDAEEEQGIQVGKIGVYQPVGALSYSPVPLTEAMVYGYRETVAVTGMILGFLRDLVTGGVSPRSLGSILTIGEASGQAAAAGVDTFLRFMALFSVNLAILNLLPIPVFLALIAVGPVAVETQQDLDELVKQGETSDGEVTPTYAGFWVRFCAYVIDMVVVVLGAGILGIIIGIAAGLVSPDSLLNRVFEILLQLVESLVGAAYFVFMHSSSKQATLGKMAMGLKVTDLDGERIGVGKAFLRLIGTFVSGVLLMIGYLMVAFTERKQGLHDKIAGTLVVRS